MPFKVCNIGARLCTSALFHCPGTADDTVKKALFSTLVPFSNIKGD